MRYLLLPLAVLACWPLAVGAQSVLDDGAHAVLSNPAALGVLPGWEMELRPIEFDLRQYGGYVTSLGEIQDLLTPGKRFRDLPPEGQARVLQLLQGFSGTDTASAVRAQAFVAGKFRNFGIAIVGRSRGGADLTLDGAHLTAKLLTADQSFIDSATLSALEARVAYSHSLLAEAEHSQLYAGATLRLMRGQTAAFHTLVQELGDSGNRLRPSLFNPLAHGQLKADLDLGFIYTYKTWARIGLGLEGAINPSFDVAAPTGYQGARSLSFGRQLVLSMGLTPGRGFRVSAESALTRRASSLDRVYDRQVGAQVEKNWGESWTTRVGLRGNLDARLGPTALLGLRWKALDGELFYSPRQGLLTQDQLGATVSLRLDRKDYPPGD